MSLTGLKSLFWQRFVLYIASKREYFLALFIKKSPEFLGLWPLPSPSKYIPWTFASFISSVQFSSVTQSCLTLHDPMNHRTPGLPVHHQLPEFTQTHVHRVSDAIQPSHPLSSPSPPAPNPFQHQCNRCWQFNLFPLPFLNPAWTSGSSWLMYYWSLAWRIFNITLLVCEISAIVW